MNFKLSRATTLFALMLAIALTPAIADAAKRSRRRVKTPPDAKEIELFAGMKSGELAVRFIPKSAKEANVLIENKLKKPVRVKLPAAFAGVPVLAQFGGMGGGGMGGMGGGMGGMGGGMGGGGMGGGQGMGGGMGGMGGGGMGGMGGGGGMGGMGGGGMGGGGGFFNVAPEKTGKFKVTTICLEHGKPDPNPRMKYTIVPIEMFTKKPEVIEMCKMLGRGEVTQNTAQAAAWHVMDKMSWVELAQKNRVKLRNGYTEKWFALQELHFAVRIVQESMRRADAYKKSYSEQKQDSLSNQQVQPVGAEE